MVERSLHELLDLDEQDSGLSHVKLREVSEAVLRLIEQRQSPDEELPAAAAELKTALARMAAVEGKLRRAYEAGDDEKRANVAPFYIRVLLDMGREAEAFEVIRAARGMRLSNPVDFAAIAGALWKHGHFADSARWYTKGLVQHVGSLAEVDLDGMLGDDGTSALVRGRRMARHALGVAPDRLDELHARYEAIVAPDKLEFPESFPVVLAR